MVHCEICDWCIVGFVQQVWHYLQGAFNINITAVEVDNEDTEVVDQWHLRYDLAPEAERLHTIRPRQLVGLRKATDPAV